MMDQFKLDLYEDEVFVFTPKGDLCSNWAKGATVLDFAFHIHSKLGCKCIGAKVNGKNVQLKTKAEQRGPGRDNDIEHADTRSRTG